MSKGLSNKEIGETLGIREGAVKWHVNIIFSRLNVNDRTEATEESAILIGGRRRISAVRREGAASRPPTSCRGRACPTLRETAGILRPPKNGASE